MGIEDFPDYDPDNDERMCPELIPALKEVLRRYADEREAERNWDHKQGYLTEEDVERLRELEEFNRFLLYLTESLVVGDKDLVLGLREFLSTRDADGRYFVSDVFELELAKAMMPILENAPNRAVDLLKLLAAASPEQSTEDFLRLVSRCYIWGFGAECVILCRSSLESALREKHRSLRKDPPNTLFKMIKSAATERWLDREGFKAANAVRHRARILVHDSAAARTDVLDTMRKTLGLIDQLHRK